MSGDSGERTELALRTQAEVAVADARAVEAGLQLQREQIALEHRKLEIALIERRERRMIFMAVVALAAVLAAMAMVF